MIHVKWIASAHVKAYAGLSKQSKKPVPKEWRWLRDRLYALISAKHETDAYIQANSSVITYEPVELESERAFDPEKISFELDNSEKEADPEGLDPIKIRSALSKHFAPILYYEYFTMHKNLNYKKYEKVLKTARELLPRFLHMVYKEYYSVNYAITSDDIDNFVDKFGSIEGFSFTGEDIQRFLSQVQNIEVTDQTTVSETCNEAFETYSAIFDGFRQYIEGNLGAM